MGEALSPLEGSVIWVAPAGSVMSRWHVLAWIKPASGAARQVFCPEEGVVDRLLVQPGGAVQAGAPLAVLTPLPAPQPDTVAIQKGLLPIRPEDGC